MLTCTRKGDPRTEAYCSKCAFENPQHYYLNTSSSIPSYPLPPSLTFHETSVGFGYLSSHWFLLISVPELPRKLVILVFNSVNTKLKHDPMSGIVERTFYGHYFRSLERVVIPTLVNQEKIFW